MICFALLAHKDEQALLEQVKNIRKYAGKDALIVLYNGGANPNFGKSVCKSENVMYCPYSRPLQPRKTGRFFYDVMRWLDHVKLKYEFLVYTESDVLFINKGFKAFLTQQMNGYECMVKIVRKIKQVNTDWKPGRTMWNEWDRWQPFFQKKYFYSTLNPMQVYRRSIVKRILEGIDRNKLESLFASTDVYALGEMLYVTLAKKYGARCRTYPEASIKYLRFGPQIKLAEIKKAQRAPEVMFVHPVKDDAVRKWITEQRWRLKA